MFKNVGSKIQDIAFIIATFGIVTSLIAGLIFIYVFHESALLVLTGLIIILFGSVCSWIAALFMHGFGQLVENSEIIVKQNDQLLYGNDAPSDEQFETTNVKE